MSGHFGAPTMHSSNHVTPPKATRELREGGVYLVEYLALSRAHSYHSLFQLVEL